MSFITNESGIYLSESGQTSYTSCGEMIRETAELYVLTEKRNRIVYDGSCDPVLDFNCSGFASKIDSNFVTIVNTCTMPITVTGFNNSNPERFSIFKYPEYSGMAEYNTGNTEELPFTIEPFQRVIIDTFFHPLYSELLSGTPGTLDNRNGDKFRSRVDIMPGFEVLNCGKPDFVSVLWWESGCGGNGENLVLMNDPQDGSGQWFQEVGEESYTPREEIFYDESGANQFFEQTGRYLTMDEDPFIPSTYCAPYFDLEGEFVCEKPEGIEFLSNSANFIEPDLSTISKIESEYFLVKKKTIQLEISPDQTIQNVFNGLDNGALAYASMLENMNPSWLQIYGDLGVSGSIGVFRSLTKGLIDAGMDNDINNLLQSTVPPTDVSYGDSEIRVSYEAGDYEEVEIEGESWTGMNIKNEPIAKAEETSNQSVFFNSKMNPGTPGNVKMFVVDGGNFDAYPMKEIV
jgi:hypothetical protein